MKLNFRQLNNFDFWKFYNGLLTRTDYCDKYWERFPGGRIFQFKKETLELLKQNVIDQNGKGLAATLAVIWRDGADRDYTDLLLALLNDKWHTLEEDIVSILELIKDPKSVNTLFGVAVNVPDYDDMRALAKKCMWALTAINTPESISKLKMLQQSEDRIIRENANFQLEQVVNKK